jgi:hypothetical protein
LSDSIVVKAELKSRATLIGPQQVGKLSGLARFHTRYPKARPLLVGTQGIPLETFFSKNAASWLVK